MPHLLHVMAYIKLELKQETFVKKKFNHFSLGKYIGTLAWTSVSLRFWGLWYPGCLIHLGSIVSMRGNFHFIVVVLQVKKHTFKDF